VTTIGEIPQKIEDDGNARCIETNPTKMTELTSEANKEFLLYPDDEDSADKAAAVRRYAGAAARFGTPVDVSHVATGVAYVADSRGEAVETVCRQLPRWLGPGLAGYVPVDERPPPRRDPYAYARLLCELHAVGTAGDCAASLAATVMTSGIGHLILLVEAGAPERTIANIARLGAEVLPVVRSRLAAPADGRGPAGG
jgi:hypothetical protein